MLLLQLLLFVTGNEAGADTVTVVVVVGVTDTGGVAGAIAVVLGVVGVAGGFFKKGLKMGITVTKGRLYIVGVL